MFKKLVLAASLVLVGTTSALAQTADKIVIKVGYGTAGGPIHEGALELKKRLEGANSRLDVQVFPGGALGSEGEIIGQLQTGMTDMLMTTTGPLGQQNPIYYVLETPYIFINDAQVDKVLDGPAGAKLLKGMEAKGLVGLAFWENGFRHLTNSRSATKTPEDAKGLKIRVMENKVHLLAFKTAGLNPTPMAWGEVYAALQQKVIDGQENPIAVIHSSKLYEVQKYLALTGHVYSPAPIIVSKKRWDQMPKEDQEIFRKTALEVAQFQRKINRDAEEAKIKEMEAKGFTVTRDVDKAAWQKAMQPAFDEFAKEFGKDKIDAIINTK